MPLNAYGWSTEEDQKLAELVEPHSYLYNVQDPSRKNILARESTWQEIAQQLSKPGKVSITKNCAAVYNSSNEVSYCLQISK